MQILVKLFHFLLLVDISNIGLKFILGMILLTYNVTQNVDLFSSFGICLCVLKEKSTQKLYFGTVSTVD